MTSLFSSFDLFFFYKALLLFFLLILVVTSSVFMVNSQNKFMESLFLFNLTKFFFSLKCKSFTKFSTGIFISIFLSIFMLNFFSVFPYNFPFSSQVSNILFLSFSFWFSFFMFGMTKNFKGSIQHFVPEGSPLLLSLFLFLIELVSSLIRPVTLTVRLVANILAGHLLMSLLSKMIFYLPILFPTYMLLTLIEMFVALIQAYIFVTMLSLYYCD